MPSLQAAYRVLKCLCLLVLLAIGPVDLGPAGFGVPARADTVSDLRQAIDRGGLIFLMRHADAPGFGDPESFRLGDCKTQRNLGSAGREQARRLGDAFRAAGVASAEVFSSQWCRTLDTARLLDLGEVIELAALNSVFRRPEQVPKQTAELQAFIETHVFHEPTVLVTHQSNIRALTGLGPRSGEIIALSPGGAEGFHVVGSISPP